MPTCVNFLRWIGVVMALCFCDGSAAATRLPRYGMFVYSNLCVSPMSGDVGGDRILLRRFADGDTLFYEYTDGSTHAVVARALALDASMATLRFEIDIEGVPTSSVSGKFSRDGRHLALRGLPFSGDSSAALVLVTDFAAPLKQCKPLPNAH